MIIGYCKKEYSGKFFAMAVPKVGNANTLTITPTPAERTIIIRRIIDGILLMLIIPPVQIVF
jgi:hypothetical protein